MDLNYTDTVRLIKLKARDLVVGELFELPNSDRCYKVTDTGYRHYKIRAISGPSTAYLDPEMDILSWNCTRSQRRMMRFRVGEPGVLFNQPLDTVRRPQ